jgi:hypothetical protein
MKKKFASSKSLKKGVGSGVGSVTQNCGSGSAPKCHGSPTLIISTLFLGRDEGDGSIKTIPPPPHQIQTIWWIQTATSLFIFCDVFIFRSPLFYLICPSFLFPLSLFSPFFPLSFSPSFFIFPLPSLYLYP